MYKIRKTDAVDGNWLVTDKETGKELGTIVAKHNPGKKTTAYNEATAKNGESRNFQSVRDAAEWMASLVVAVATPEPAVEEAEQSAAETEAPVEEPIEQPVEA